VENQPLQVALLEAARAAGVRLRPTAVANFHSSIDGIRVELADGTAVNARLLVAADGAHSGIRERAGIASYGWAYGQSAIVTTVAHERDHGGRAQEHFLAGGPFAILPLKQSRSSIVWT
jgi:2-octaprenyl-6-methoxyphenol hydroxylase